jgi:hypothetical protein
VDDVDAALAAHPPADETARSTATPRRCRRHTWALWPEEGVTPIRYRCIHCPTFYDPGAVRRGTSARRLGHDQERRIERTYGPRKVGEFGDAIDLIGRDFAWQSKATRGPMPAWLAAVDTPTHHDPPSVVRMAAAAMRPIMGARYPLVIMSWVSPGVRTRDRIWVLAPNWWMMHGEGGLGWIVMSGEHFLETHGRDTPKEGG